MWNSKTDWNFATDTPIFKSGDDYRYYKLQQEMNERRELSRNYSCNCWGECSYNCDLNREEYIRSKSPKYQDKYEKWCEDQWNY